MLVLIGPSGSGKSTVARELHRRGIVAVTPSWTTRPRRADEVDGTIEHRFVTDAEFDALERAGFFLEVVRPFGLGYRYGLPPVPPPEPGRVPAILVRAPLMGLVDKHFPDHVTYQIEDSYQRAMARVAAAGSDLGSRLDDFEAERLLGHTTADRVFVNRTSVTDLVAGVAAAIAQDFEVERSHIACRTKG
jgi:ribose 1,5-bisphosphokinase